MTEEIGNVTCASAAISKSKLWIIGGINESREISSQVYSIDLRNTHSCGSASRHSDVHESPFRVYNVLLTNPPKDAIHVFGGHAHDGKSDVSNATFSKFNPQEWREVTLSAPNLPLFPCMDHTSTQGYTTWIFGGRLVTETSVTNKFYEITTKSRKITIKEINSLSKSDKWPSPRCHGVLLKLSETSLILIGGQDEFGKPLNDWWLFDFLLGKWRFGGSVLGSPREGHRAVVVNKRYVFVSGGQKQSWYSFMEMIDTIEGTTCVVDAHSVENAPIPISLCMHNMVFFNNQLLIFNGRLDKGRKCYNKNLYVASLKSNQDESSRDPFTVTWEKEFVPDISAFDPSIILNLKQVAYEVVDSVLKEKDRKAAKYFFTDYIESNAEQLIMDYLGGQVTEYGQMVDHGVMVNSLAESILAEVGGFAEIGRGLGVLGECEIAGGGDMLTACRIEYCGNMIPECAIGEGGGMLADTVMKEGAGVSAECVIQEGTSLLPECATGKECATLPQRATNPGGDVTVVECAIEKVGRVSPDWAIRKGNDAVEECAVDQVGAKSAVECTIGENIGMLLGAFIGTICGSRSFGLLIGALGGKLVGRLIGLLLKPFITAFHSKKEGLLIQ